MKKWILVMIAAMMITACGQKKEETVPAQTETTTEMAEAESTERELEESSRGEEESAKTDGETSSESESEEKEISGTVIDAAMNTIIIKTDDGQELSFSKEDAEVELKDGLTLGIRVTLTYTGEIQGDSTLDTKVLRITDAN